MSLLSIKKFASALRPALRLGLHIDRQQVAAVTMAAKQGQWTPTAQASKALTHAWFSGTPTPQAVEELAGAMRELCAPVAREFVAINVSIPDPAVNYAVFEFDELPRDEKALDDLIRWRFGKDLHYDERRIACRYQRLGRDGQKLLVLGVALDKLWLDALTAAIQLSGLAVSALDSATAHRFNYHYPWALQQGAQAGGLVALEDDYWSVCLWDDDARIRFVRARWRKTPGDIDAIVAETIRIVQAYRGAGGQRRLAGIAVITSDDANRLSADLEKRLALPCPVIDNDTQFQAAVTGAEPGPLKSVMSLPALRAALA